MNRVLRRLVRRARSAMPLFEPLEPRQLMAAQPVIAEFMASNSTTIQDQDGDYSDWIEIRNAGDQPIDLIGWHLTDNDENLDKWTFPSVVLNPGQQIVVFASGKDRAVAGAQLHTDFQLDIGGEYLALVRPNGFTIAHQFAPEYPPQATDIAYGLVPEPVFSDLLSPGDGATTFIPADGSLGQTWTGPLFDDSTWNDAQSGIGFDTGVEFDPLIGAGGDLQASMLSVNSTAYMRFPFSVDAPEDVQSLRLRMKYDDGFIAYLNGVEIARRNAPSFEPPSNIALDGQASGSSEGHGTVFADGNDGNRDGSYANGSVWHTTGTPESNPPSYYQVDLGSEFYLDRVQIFPRTDAAQSSVQNFRITVLDSEDQLVFSRDYFTTGGQSTLDKPWGTNDLRNILGQTVRIQRLAQNEPNFMTFSEFEVYGSTSPIALNLALNRPVTASAAGFSTTAARANDGNIDGNYNHTGNPVYRSAASGIGQFWQVDLGSMQEIQYLNLFTRTDLLTTGPVRISALDASMAEVYSTTIDLAAASLGGAPYHFTHRIPSPLTARHIKIATTTAQFLALGEVEVFGPVRPTLSLDLADVVGGGDGTGTGGDQGISTATGAVVTSHRDNITGGPVNTYHTVPSNPYIDGVFVPDGNTGVAVSIPVSSTGLMVSSISDTNGASWDDIWNGDSHLVSGGPVTASRIGMHASKGITFDLNAIELDHPDMRAAGFSTLAALGNQATASVDFYILLDGVIADSISLNGANQSSLRSIAIPESARFLTLLTSSRGSDSADWSFFGDPSLGLASTAPVSSADHLLAAAASRSDAQALVYETIDVSAFSNLLQAGTNVLAVHGLNVSASDPDFLILPVIEAGLANAATNTVTGFILDPTPGAPNSSMAVGTGPAITQVDHSPQRPAAGQSLTVTARVTAKADVVQSVTLHYRGMFAGQSSITMFDDGLHGDGMSQDGIYGATIPAGVAGAGEMLRWYITAVDTGTRDSRNPSFLDQTGTRQSPAWFGTVVADPAVTSALPILEWFSDNLSGVNSRTGGRASAFYDGQFYDNVFVRLRGAFTAGNSQKFVFNKGHEFYVNELLGRVSEFNLNTNGSDQSYLRQTLAFETYRNAGVPSNESFLLRSELNGSFSRVGIWIEQTDENFLERHGLDPDGALYKLTSSPNPAYSAGTVAEKKTRTDESTADFQALVTGLNLATVAQQKTFLFDSFDIAGTINYLAARAIVQDIDDTRKNHYIYRDTNGDGEWAVYPWDKDWTFGEVGGGGLVVADRSDEIASGNANFNFATHPFIGDSTHMLYQVQWSRMLEVFHAVPETKQMFLRRLRTLMEELLQAPGTPLGERLFENRVDELFASASAHLSAAVATHVANLKNQYFEPKRISLFQDHSIDNLTPPDTTVLLPEFASGARWFVPTNDTLGLNWTQRLFSDVAWGIGSTGVGYENAPSTYQSLIQTRVKPTETVGGSTSFFVRIPFNVANINDVTNLTLRMKYDDGFVAYLNGVEVARRNIGGAAGTQVAFNALATNRPNASAAVFEDINIAAFTGSLLNGNNVLAIHGINTGTTSSDMLILPMLVEGTAGNADAAGIPHEQSGNPLITVASVEFNPASGNQDQEYIQFTNPNLAAVDISGWHVAGAIDHTFAPGTVIPAGGSVYLTPDSKAFRARTTGPRGGQGLFVQGGFDGHLSNFGETIELYGSNNALVSSHTYTGDPTDQQEQLRITEVNYNPSEPTASEITAGFTDNDQFEFIELRNISGVLPLSLLDVEFVSGVSFNFTGSAITMLAPGERVLIVADSAAFTARYGAGLPVAGQYTGSLSNDGETIKIEDSTNSTVAEFSYSDSGEWPGRADGNGSALHVIDIDGDYNAAGNWRSSGLYNGSPGAEDVLTLDVIINEVLTHTDLPQRDSIELYNTTGSAIDLSGWWISDSKNYTKFQIPIGTMIDAHGYLLFDEEDFNPTPETPAANHFSFDGAHGEEAHLLRGAIGNPVPLSFADGADFDAAFNGISFGRVPNGDPNGELFPNISPTPNAANSGPQFGPLMIAEVMYHAPGEDNDLEYIELYNSSRTAIDLTNWRLAGAADFDFAPGTIIGPRQSLVILGFDPLEPLNADKIAAFELAYSVTIDGDFIGPFLGNLADEGERVKLQAPDEEPLDEPGFIPHPLHDEVKYDDAAPWSLTADGLGDSLHRYTPKNYGHTAISWRGQPPTPGRARGDIDGDGTVTAADIDGLFDNAGSASPLNDLTTDGNTDTLDIDLLVQDILCTFYGDADLNQQVSIGDLTVLAEHFGEVGTASWSTGDFNGDDSVSIGDLTLLAENFGDSNPLTGFDDSGADSTTAGLQALGDGAAANSDDDEEDDDTLIDILADLGDDLR